MKLLKVDTIQQVLEKMEYHFGDIELKGEVINIEVAVGRTAKEDTFSQYNIPDFNRSTVDGYAIVASDTFGVTDSIPVFLDVIGQVEMGKSTDIVISKGKAAYVPTGGMVPKGADAVIMIEHIEEMDSSTIAAYSSTAPGENVIKIGDDISKGDQLIHKGKQIRPQDIGVLTAAGIRQITVFEKPKAAVISTGDEIADPFGEIQYGEVRDINTYTLAAMLEEMGAAVTIKSVIKDEYELLKSAVEAALIDNHIVIISGGSSVGTKDVTAKVIESMGEPGVFVHGMAVKPGKPTIVGKAMGKALFGLPGHPVSAVIVFKVLIGHFMARLMNKENFKLQIPAVCSVNVHSSPGKETFQMVELEQTENGYAAIPLHGKSGAISLVSRAQGFVRIPHNKEGISKGETVMVELL
ncbi:MAG: molybdopterin molybdotransferase MoeA [Clostridia bacterium]|jgi:molybdopterin molybdotransferase|nr:molybdopterin molybdotransferase MoeA [Clostridia bacterium]